MRRQVEAIAAVASSLDAQTGSLPQRRNGYARLARQYRSRGGEFNGRLAKVMRGWQAGLFVAVSGKGGPDAPWDNL